MTLLMTLLMIITTIYILMPTNLLSYVCLYECTSKNIARYMYIPKGASFILNPIMNYDVLIC